MWQAWPQLTRTIDPTNEPLSLAQAKAHCSLTASDTFYDAWFQTEGSRAIQTAREYVEEHAVRALMPQTWQLKIERFPYDRGSIECLIYPVQAIASVTYYDTNGTLQTLSSSTYTLIAGRRKSIITLANTTNVWPNTDSTRPGPVTITLTCGYSLSSASLENQRKAVPASLGMAMLLLINHWFEQRSAVLVGTISKEMELGVEALLNTPARFHYA